MIDKNSLLLKFSLEPKIKCWLDQLPFSRTVVYSVSEQSLLSDDISKNGSERSVNNSSD